MKYVLPHANHINYDTQLKHKARESEGVHCVDYIHARSAAVRITKKQPQTQNRLTAHE